MVETSRKLHINNIQKKFNMVVPARTICFFLLLFFLMMPTNGNGIPPYCLIGIISIPFLLKKIKLKVNKEYGFLIIYAFTYISSLFFHYYSGSIILAASFIAYYFLSPLIVRKSVITKKDFNMAISFLIICFSIYSVLGIIEAISGINVFDIIYNRSGNALWAGIGITRYGLNLSYGFLRIMHNNAALMCMIWAIAAYKLCNTTTDKWFWTLCWFVIGAYDIVMMSRMIIFMAPILQLIIFRKRGSKWLTKRVFAIVVVVLVVISIFGSDVFYAVRNTVGGLAGPIIDEFFGTSLGNQFDSGLGGSGQRLILWKWIFEEVKDSIFFGKGFTDIWSTTISGRNYLGQVWYTEKTSIEVHWLYTLYRMGLYGLFGFVVFQIGVLAKLWKTKVNSFEKKVTFQFVMKWIAVFYFIHLFGIAAAEELYFFYALFALYLAYERICSRDECIE